MIGSFANSVITLILLAFGSHHRVQNGPRTLDLCEMLGRNCTNGPLMLFRDGQEMWDTRGDLLGHYTPGDYLKYPNELWRLVFGREISLKGTRWDHSSHYNSNDDRNILRRDRDSRRSGPDYIDDYSGERVTPDIDFLNSRLGQGGSANINPGGLPFKFDYEYRLGNYEVTTCITGNMWYNYADSATLMTRCTCQLDCNYLIQYSRDATVWKVMKATGYREGLFKLKNRQTGKCLTLGLDNGTSKTKANNNDSFKQMPCADYARAQVFKIGERYTSNPLSVAKNAVAIESLLANMDVPFDDLRPLAITGGSFEGDGSVWAATFEKRTNQFWYFKEA